MADSTRMNEVYWHFFGSPAPAESSGPVRRALPGMQGSEIDAIASLP
jgi:hypothetical protein